MDSQRWVRAAGAAGGLLLFAAILGWFFWTNLRTPPLAQRGQPLGPVETVPTAPQDRQVRDPPAREAADKRAAEELAALGRGPTHIMAMAADSGTRVPRVTRVQARVACRGELHSARSAGRVVAPMWTSSAAACSMTGRRTSAMIFCPAGLGWMLSR